MRKLQLVVCCLLFLCPLVALAQNSMSPSEARNHIGEFSIVCGRVASTHFARTTRGSPTFINLDKAYPNQIFVALIWGGDRPKFGKPEESYENKEICVTGTISDYKGVPEIVVHETSQIRMRANIH